MRRRIAIGAAAVALTLTSSSAAFRQFVIVRLTPAGPTPAVVHVTAGDNPVAFVADGTAGESVVFDDGSCTVQVAPSDDELSGCVFSAGTHTYRVVATGQTVAQGTVVADPAFRRVTIAASAPAVTYGEAVRLSGTVERELASPPQEFDDAVDVFARPFEHLSYRLARVTARSEGFVVHWTIEVRPVRRTEYRAGTLADTAVYDRALSAAVAVDVRPAVSVRAAEGRLSVSVRPARAYAGGRVVLERREGALWRPVGAITLRGDATAAIAVRPGSFRVRVPAAPGYVATASRPATSR